MTDAIREEDQAEQRVCVTSKYWIDLTTVKLWPEVGPARSGKQEQLRGFACQIQDNN